MKRILTVQDISCFGKCSLTVALPIISAMGVEAVILPTAVLSTHTQFKGFTFHDLTQEITPICQHWKKEGIKFDALYTGYLGSFEQIDLMKKLFETFTDKDTLRIVDPCMGDNGALYKGFNQEFASKMAELAGIADVILPNLTEASFMLGVPYKTACSYDQAYIEDLLVSLSKLGAKKVILKGIEFANDQPTLKGIVGKIGIASYDASTKRTDYYFHKKQPKSYHGTGDIFASVCVGALMRGMSLRDSYKLAGDFVSLSIEKTEEHLYGVDFEYCFSYLINELHKTGICE